VCIEGQRGGIFRSDNRRRWSKNGERKVVGSYRVAGAKEYERCAEVLGASKLLQTVCERFCYDSKALV